MTWTVGTSVGGVFHARFRLGLDVYGGPDSVDGQSMVANLGLPSFRGCPVVTSTLGTASTVFGASDSDTVTVTGTGGVTPTGSVDFWACLEVSGPCDPNAVGATDLGTTTLAGTGDSATASASFTPPTSGRYCFADSYGGDGHYRSIFNASDDLCFTVAPATPAVTGAPTLTEIPLGKSDTDTATVTGAGEFTPTGTVTFYACGPSSSPTPTSCTPAAGTEVGNPVSLGPTVGSPPSASATSDAFTTTAGGVYCFLALYSGDAGYGPGSDGSTSDQCFGARGPGPEFSTEPTASSIVLGATDTDTATLTGEGDVTPTGDIHFYVCPESDDPCTATDVGAVDLGTTPLSGSSNAATATSAAFTPPALGDYCFIAVYSGDDNYGSETENSNDGCFTVTSATPAAPVLGSPENGSPKTAGTANPAESRKSTKPTKVEPGSTWTLVEQGTRCVGETFAKHHAFTESGTGATGTYKGTTKLTMSWTAGNSTGGVFKGKWSKKTGDYSGSYTFYGQSVPTTLVPVGTGKCVEVTSSPATATIDVGGSVNDSAIVAGSLFEVTPTGNVHFYVCPGDSFPCTPTATGAVDLGTAAVSGSDGVATADSVPYRPPATGTYCFLGVYSGDSNYVSASDGSEDECFQVTGNSPSVTSQPDPAFFDLGGSTSDTATVTGAGGVTPTGSVTFYLCGPDVSFCSVAGNNVLGSPATVSGTGNSARATSIRFTPSTTGAYCFASVYSGESHYPSSSDGSEGECFQVVSAS
jgi:hypothetical protein